MFKSIAIISNRDLILTITRL